MAILSMFALHFKPAADKTVTRLIRISYFQISVLFMSSLFPCIKLLAYVYTVVLNNNKVKDK